VRTVLAIALADFRDRFRRRSFLAVMSMAAFLGLQAIQGRIDVSLGRFTGAPTSAWAGILMAMVGATFLGIAGFWAVKGSVARDASTGVGAILAATPISKAAYTVGKALSHFWVLATMCGVLVVAAFVLLLVSPAGEAIEPLQIVLPILLLALPGMAFVAACAVLFESVRWLARGFGNLLWFFVWTLLLVATMETNGFDVFGISTARSLLGERVRAIDPAWNGGFVIGANRAEDRASETFRWERLPVSPRLVAQRTAVVGLAVLLAWISAVPFDRFDPARRRLRLPRRAGASPADSPGERAAPRGSVAVAAAPLAPVGREREASLLPLARAELRIAVRAMPRWWLLGAAGLSIGGLVAQGSAREGWLAAAFLWPALVWSGLAARDRDAGLTQLLVSMPSPLARQLPALLVAGWLGGLLSIGGGVVGLALAGSTSRALAVLAGAGAAALLGVACGVVSGGARLFEGLYVALWYFGPLQHAWPLDFSGVTAESAAHAMPLVYLGFGAALLVSALAVERRRLADGSARFV